MFRIIAVGCMFMLTACNITLPNEDAPVSPSLSTPTLVQNNKPKEGMPPPGLEYFGTQKPILCQKTESLLIKFTDDKNEQMIAQYDDPVHETGGMVWWNSENDVLHVIEFPPQQGKEWACVTVFGVNTRFTDEPIRKKGTSL